MLTILVIWLALNATAVIAGKRAVKTHFEDTDAFLDAMGNPDENSYS